MPNQYVNKVVFGDQTLLDLTSDTVTPSVLMEGYTAHDKSGALIIGTATGGGTGAISVVDTTDTHGGTIRTITAVDISDTTAVANDVAQGKYFYTADGTKTAGTSSGGGGGDNWSWMGKNPTKVATSLSEKVFLKDSAFATWTPTTTNTTIVTGENLNGYTANLDDYDYVVRWKFHTHFEYDGTEQNQFVTDYYYTYSSVAFGFPNSLSYMTDGLNNGYTTSGMQSRYGLFYKNSSVDTYSALSQYGVFIYSSPSLSINTGTKVITPKSFTITARCGNGYFSTASASAVDQNASYYEQVVEIWRVDLGTSPTGGAAKTVRDMWLAGDII